MKINSKVLVRNKYILLLSIISILLLASVVRYGLRTFKIPEWDEQHYMRMATEFYRLIKYNLSFNTPYEMLQIVPFRQPGYPLLIVPFFLVFGLSHAYFWGIVTNGLLYVLSIFGIYFLAKNFMSRLSSFLAAFIFAFYSWTLLYVHLTYSETATSAFSILAILFLIKSNYFRNRKFSILFGVFLGLGLLMKWITMVYVLGPLFYVLYQIFKKCLYKNKEIIVSGLISIVLIFIISMYPYYKNFYWIVQYFYGHRKGGPMWLIVPQDERNPLSFYSLTFYLNSFNQLGTYYLVLIISGFVLALRNKSNIKPILLTIIISYLFSAFALLKADRYIIPIYPYLAILSASIFDYLKNIKLKLLVIALTVVLSIGSFLGSVWGRGPMSASLSSLNVKLPFNKSTTIYLTGISRPPYIYKISGEEILDFISKDSKENKIENPQILSLFYYHPLDEPLMTYNLYNQEKPFSINNFVGTVINDPDKDSKYFMQSVFGNSDYILTKSGKRTDDYFSEKNYTTLKALIALFDDHFTISDYYEEKTKIWIYQDSSEVTIFKKKREIPNEKLQKMGLKFADILKTTKE